MPYWLRSCAALVSAFAILVIVPATPVARAQQLDLEPAFSDIEDHWAEDTISVMQRSGVIYALEDDRFGPDQPITRLDFTRWILRLLGEPPGETGEVDFVDTEGLSPEERADIQRAVELGLLEGFPDDTFRPDETVDRVQLATILGRSLVELGVQAHRRDLDIFDDSDEIPEWALPAAAAVSPETQLIYGRVAYEIFAPNDPTTRAEAVTMLSRFIRKFRELGGSTAPDPDADAPDHFKVAGWYLGRDEARGDSYRTVRDHGSRINLAIMSSYALEMHDDGYIVGSGYDSPFLFSWASESKNRRTLVRITNGSFCPDLAKKILNDPVHTERALEVIGTILERGYDGVDLNFESVRPEDRNALNNFVAELRARYGEDYLITMPVHAKLWDGPNHWYYAYDYETLGRLVDYLIPMAYDQHWSTASPGPVAAAWWVENVIRYTLTQVPREKVLLGVPFYGYDWEDVDDPHRARAYTWPSCLDRAGRFGAQIEWSDGDSVPYYRYADEDGKKRIVYFENEESLAAKLELVTDYGLAGVSFWRLGQEHPDAWGVINEMLP
ncbi:MAG: glycosyl hydrolase family 18 protein [Bacillota bacterium]